MRNIFFCALFCTAQLYTMENVCTFPSLQALCLKTLAHELPNEYGAQSTESEKKDLYAILDELAKLSKFKQFEQLETPFFTIIPKDLHYPIVIAQNNTTAFFEGHKEQYVGALDSLKCLSLEECPLQMGSHSINPAFSPDGTLLIGWEKHGSCLCTINLLTDTPIIWDNIRGPQKKQYAFTAQGAIVLRTDTGLFILSSDTLEDRGSVSRLNDTQKYPSSNYKALHAFTNSLITCVGPDEKSFEVFEREDSTWQKKSNFMTREKIAHTAYAPHEPLIATIEHDSFKKYVDASRNVYLYHVTNHTSSLIAIRFLCCLPFSAAFSPDGQHLACGTTINRGEIDIVDCSDLKNLFICATINAVSSWQISDIHWHSTGIYIKDGRLRLRITVNPHFASLFATYKESKKPKKPESNNNNA